MAEMRSGAAGSYGNQHPSNAQETAASFSNVESDASDQHGTIRSWAAVDLHRPADSLGQGNGLAALNALSERMQAGTTKESGILPGHDHSLHTWTGAAPSASEFGVATAPSTSETAARHITAPSSFDQFSAPNASYSGPSLDTRRHPFRPRVNPALVMDAQTQPPNFFATPDRAAPTAASTVHPLYHNTPTSSNRKRKADTDGLQLQVAPQQSPVKQLATPTQGPPPAGIFGSQARSLRGGQRRSVQIDQFPPPPLPPQELFAQLQEIPQLLSGSMADLTQMLTHLARKHKSLEQRVATLERENTMLKGEQPSLPPDSDMMQQDEPMTNGDAVQAQQPDGGAVSTEIDLQPRKKFRKAMPLPGGAYGGPLYTQPSKSPGMFSGMFANNRKTSVSSPANQPSRAFANNRQNAVPSPSKQPSGAAPAGDDDPLGQEADSEVREEFEERDYYGFD